MKREVAGTKEGGARRGRSGGCGVKGSGEREE